MKLRGFYNTYLIIALSRGMIKNAQKVRKLATQIPKKTKSLYRDKNTSIRAPQRYVQVTAKARLAVGGKLSRLCGRQNSHRRSHSAEDISAGHAADCGESWIVEESEVWR